MSILLSEKFFTSFRMFVLIVLIGMLSETGSGIKLWASPAILPAAVPASCKAVMAVDIACSPRFIKEADIRKDVPFNETFLGEYCSSTCSSSLNTYITNVNTRCGSTTYDFGTGIGESAGSLIAPLKWARDVACSTGTSANDFCYPKIVNRQVGFCDDCTLKHIAGLLNSEEDVGKINKEDFTSVLSSCQVSATKFPVTKTAQPSAAQPTSTSEAGDSCWGGETYTVKQGDTCESVAAANGMAIDRFLSLNGIDYHCEAFGVGRPVCIRDACKLHTITPQESCNDIVNTYGFTKLELVQWNPTLQTGCDNATALAGRSICITPPGTDKYDFTATASLNDTWTWPAGNWVSGPTQGTPLTNKPTTWDVPTITATWAATVDPSTAAYFKYCPITDQHWEEGFDWSLLSNVCLVLLEKYCEPEMTGNPLPSTTFPSSCFPPYPTNAD